jgi:hypothetical protein
MSWMLGPDLPLLVGNNPKHVLLQSGEILVLGHSPDPGATAPLAFNSSTGRWKRLAPIPSFSGADAIALPDGTVLISSGFSSGGYVIYDPAMEKVVTRGNLPLLPPNDHEGSFSLAIFDENRVFALANDEFYKAFLFDLPSRTWSEVTPIHAHIYPVMLTVTDRLVIVFGGVVSNLPRSAAGVLSFNGQAWNDLPAPAHPLGSDSVVLPDGRILAAYTGGCWRSRT